MPFVNAYSSATGQKLRVPARWLDHPKLRKGLRKTPLQKAAETAPVNGDNTTKEK